MNQNHVTLEEAVAAALQLSPLDKVRLIEQLVPTLESDLAQSSARPLPPWRGLLADLGRAPSGEEIDEARREAWANFPREDI